MIWRDGDYIKWHYDLFHFYACLISEIDLALERLNDWLGYRGYTFFFRQHLHQSFLLDYIEYLIESAIDRQLTNEELDRQKRWFYREPRIRALYIVPQRTCYRDEYNNEIL